MKRHYKLVALATVLVLLGLPPGGHAQQSSQSVYTWVDKNGVRHYSDQPGSPKAVLVTIQALASVSAAAGAHAAVAAQASGSADKPQHIPRARPHETAAERAARCAKLRAEVKQLQSARRVEITQNGKKRFASGENLVKFRQQMQKRMQAACKPLSP